MRKILYVAASAAAIALGAAGAAAPALAGTGPVVATTHSFQHADTTSVSGACTAASPNGPVWAYDNLSERFTVTPESGPGNYSVTIDTTGQFQAFADPRTGACYTGNGSVRGTIQYDVQSPNAPDPSLLPAQENPDTGLGTALRQLFNGDAAIVGGGSYTFTYNPVNGAPYVQTG